MKKTLIALSMIALAAASSPARADLTFTPITIPGSTDVQVYGINNAGVASGYYLDDGGNLQGFLAANGAVQTIHAPGAPADGGAALFAGSPNAGTFAGFYYDTENVYAGVYNSNTGAWTTYDITLPPGGTMNTATAVNDSGQLFGTWFDIEGTSKGWVHQDGVTTVFDPPRDVYGADGVFYSGAGANNAGDNVGEYFDANHKTHGFIYHSSSGTFSYYDVPGAAGTNLEGINDLGDIVGSYGAGGAVHGFLLSHTGSLTTVDYPGAGVTTLTGINDQGQLVGLWTNDDGVTNHSFFATFAAVPEPSSPVLLLTAVGMLLPALLKRTLGDGHPQ